MNTDKYPRLSINLAKLKHNVNYISNLCGGLGITVSGVVKGTNGMDEIIQTFIEAGMSNLASSRLSQLRKIKNNDSSIHTLALRIPMLSELEELVQVADCSLNSEIETLKALNSICKKLKIHHEVLLMCDLGDLREGFFDKDELIEAALFVENSCDFLYLKGIGTNLGCYGSIEPDTNNLGQLVSYARDIEEKIGRKLDWISGGASTSVPLVLNKTMPEGINHLRIGDNIFLRDMELYFDYKIEELYGDIFVIEGEIIEIHDKPSYPIGTISVDAFGNKPEYVDLGIRTRALLAMGRQDLGDMTKLIPRDKNLQIMGGSSDHTILDITDAKDKYQLGDKVTFIIQYENLLFSSSSEYMHKHFIKE